MDVPFGVEKFGWKSHATYSRNNFCYRYLLMILICKDICFFGSFPKKQILRKKNIFDLCYIGLNAQLKIQILNIISNIYM